MKDRIILIMDYYQLQASKLADELGIQRSGMSHILSGRNNPSLDVVQRILNHFPDINPEWLLVGKPPMIKELSMADPNQMQLFDAAPIEQPVSSNRDTSVIKTPNTVSKEENVKNEVKNPEKNTETVVTVKESLIVSNYNEITEPEPQLISKEIDAVNINSITSTSNKEEIRPAAVTQTNKSKPERQIERVMIFYTDGTFTTHIPQ